MPTTVPYVEIIAEQLRDPAFKAAYDALEPWYQRQCRRIERRIAWQRWVRSIPLWARFLASVAVGLGLGLLWVSRRRG